MKITKKRLNLASKKVVEKLIKAESVSEIIRCHKTLNKMTFLLNKHHNKSFAKKPYKPLKIGACLRLNKKYQEQAQERQWIIQGHPTFFCPVTNLMLDMDNSFLFKNIILHNNALDLLKKEELRNISL